MVQLWLVAESDYTFVAVRPDVYDHHVLLSPSEATVAITYTLHDRIVGEQFETCIQNSWLWSLVLDRRGRMCLEKIEFDFA